MKHYKFRLFCKKVSVCLERLLEIMTLPHIILSDILFILTIISFGISFYYNQNNDPFLSSIFANIFAGLITGLVVCCISGIKQIYIFKIDAEIKWLEGLHKQLLEFIDDHHKLLTYHFDEFDGDEEAYNFIIDLGCKAKQANSIIEQSSFNKTLPFNSIKLCKNELGYNAICMSKNLDELYEKLLQIDFNYPSSKEIISYFDSVHYALWKLNASVLNKISSLKVYEAMLQKSIL